MNGAFPGNLLGRTAIVTGAAGLLGSALVRAFAGQGARVVAFDINRDGLDELVDRSAGVADVVGIAGDVTSRDSIEQMMDIAVDRFGRIDMLVNNAGGNHRTLPHNVTDADFSTLLTLNLTSCFLMCQVIGKHMISHGGGSIVNISSTCGCSAMGRGNFSFSIAKSGVNHLTRELALEWGPSGVRVNVVAPSQIDSPGMREWMLESDTDGRLLGDKFLDGTPLRRLVTADDVASAVLFLASDAAAMISGTVLPVDGGNLVANAVSTGGSAPL